MSPKWPRKPFSDQQPGEQCCAGESSTGKQGRRLLLSSLPSALQVGICTKMEPEQDTHLSAALHLVSMAHRTDKSAPDSTHSRHPESYPRTPSNTPMFSAAFLSHGPTAGAGTTPPDCSGPFHTALGTQAAPHGHGNGWQTCNPVSSAVQERAAQGRRLTARTMGSQHIPALHVRCAPALAAREKSEAK